MNNTENILNFVTGVFNQAQNPVSIDKLNKEAKNKNISLQVVDMLASNHMQHVEGRKYVWVADRPNINTVKEISTRLGRKRVMTEGGKEEILQLSKTLSPMEVSRKTGYKLYQVLYVLKPKQEPVKEVKKPHRDVETKSEYITLPITRSQLKNVIRVLWWVSVCGLGFVIGYITGILTSK
jgi:hypothetical protein